MSLDLTNRKPPDELDKLPKPTNENLKLLFHAVDKVVIKNGGVHQNKAITNEIVHMISDPHQIQHLQALMEIDERMTGFHCMCLGDYAIELHAQHEIKATIGFHHGVSIWYDNWNGDALLAKNTELLNYLASLGFTKPLDDLLEDEKRRQEDQEAQKKWMLQAPKCFETYWMQILDPFTANYWEGLLHDFETEEPDLFGRIRKMLMLYGSSGSPWSGYPSYEDVPRKILDTFPLQQIIEAYVSSDKNDLLQLGLGRYFCSFEFKKKWRKHLPKIPNDIIDDIDRCINQRNDADKIWMMTNLKKKKSALPHKS